MNSIDDDVDTPRVLSIPVSSSLLIHPYRFSFSLFLDRSDVVVHAIRRTMLGVSVSCASLISRTIVFPRFRTTTMMRTPWVCRIYLRRIRSLTVFTVFWTTERSIFSFFFTVPHHIRRVQSCQWGCIPFLPFRSFTLAWASLRSTRSGRGRSIFSARAVNFRSPDQTIRTR